MPNQPENNSDDNLMQIGGNAGARLLSFVQRVENLNEEIDHLKEDSKEVYAEAKGVGFDSKIIRKAVQRRKMDREKREEEDQLLALYEDTLEQQLANMMEE